MIFFLYYNGHLQCIRKLFELPIRMTNQGLYDKFLKRIWVSQRQKILRRDQLMSFFYFYSWMTAKIFFLASIYTDIKSMLIIETLRRLH